MISLFRKNEGEEGKGLEDERRRSLYMARLQEIAQPSGNPVAVEDEDMETFPPMDDHVGSIPAELPARAASPPEAVLAAGSPAGAREVRVSGDDYQKFAQHIITPKLVEALTDAVKDVHRLTSPDENKLAEALKAVGRISEEMQCLRNELTAARQQAESASFRLAKMETRIREYGETQNSLREEVLQLAAGQKASRALLESQGRTIAGLQQEAEQKSGLSAEISQLRERLDKIDRSMQSELELIAQLDSHSAKLDQHFQTFERRMAVQAGAIRMLNATNGGPEDRREELRAVFQKLEELLAPVFSPKRLPDEL